MKIRELLEDAVLAFCIGIILLVTGGCATTERVVKPVAPPVVAVPPKPDLVGIPPNEVIRRVRLYILDLETALAEAVRYLNAYRDQP